MKSAPFSTSMMYLATYAGTAIVGGIAATIISGIGLVSAWMVAIAAFIGFLSGGIIRSIVGSMLAAASDVEGDPPIAASFGIRAMMGAVASIVVGYLIIQIPTVTNAFALGALGAVLVVMLLSVVFTVMVGKR